MITISIPKAIWIARRIVKCYCVENYIFSQNSGHSNREKIIIECALSMPSNHSCDYKDKECKHYKNEIDCWECFSIFISSLNRGYDIEDKF